MKRSNFFLALPIALLVISPVLLLTGAPAAPVPPEADRMEHLGQRAALTAMDLLEYARGDPDILVLTSAGRSVVGGQTTERAISGITDVSGQRNSDGTLYQVNRPSWRPLWFYFYDKASGQGLYLEPDETCYSLSDAELEQLSAGEVFSTIALVTVNLDMMLADPDVANETRKALGQNAGAVIPMSNCWALGAPYDLMTAAMLHDHLCPGVTAGYLIAKYAEEALPITDGTSYTVISCPNWCKDDAFPVMWDITPGKTGTIVQQLSSDDEDALKAKYNTSPAGIIIRWNSTARAGQGIAVGFDWDECTPWTGPSWAYNHAASVEMMEHLATPEKYVSAMEEFEVNQTLLADLRNPANNPYEVIGMLQGGLNQKHPFFIDALEND